MKVFGLMEHYYSLMNIFITLRILAWSTGNFLWSFKKYEGTSTLHKTIYPISCWQKSVRFCKFLGEIWWNSVRFLWKSLSSSKAVVPVLVLLFVALWFILRGNLLYVFPCVILFLCFSVLLVLRLPRLGKRELILVLFVRLFGLCLFRFVGFLFLLGSGKGYGLWLWHSLDFSLTFFCDCGTPWTFLLPFFHP